MRGTFTYNQPGSGSPGLASLSGLNGAELVRPFGITLRGIDAYSVGFDGAQLGPLDKIAPETPLFDQFFQAGQDAVELDVYRNTGFLAVERAMLGFYADTVHFCPFALGQPPSNLPTTGTATYNGLADGVAVVGGQVRRLFGSAATLTIDHATGNGTVAIDLFSFGETFGAFATAVGIEFDFAPVTASLAGASGSFSGTLSNTSGDITGQVVGTLFAAGAPAAGIAFRLDDANGVRVIGAAAFRRN